MPKFDSWKTEANKVRAKVPGCATGVFRLGAEKLDGNVVVSHYSVSTALTMTCNGANGKTKSEMQQVLGYDGLSGLAVNKQSTGLNKSLLLVISMDPSAINGFVLRKLIEVLLSENSCSVSMSLKATGLL